jgi:hypothetical protein
MAFMIPQDVQEYKTDGEKQFYAFLESYAKPDTAFIAWYTPDIDDHEPDFLLYNQKTGLVIFEVKDWTLDQIEKADPNSFSVRKGAKLESCKNPLKQAKEYLYKVMDKIKDDGLLISKDPAYHGNLTIPIECGVVFPNINKYEYKEKGLDRLISTDKIYFWDDMHPASDICSDPTGKCFSDTLFEKFSSKFDFSLTGKELDHLKQLLFPTIKLELPERKSETSYAGRSCRLKGLDHHQEALARKFDGGHRILVGPSGCGKTLILVHKAAFLKQYNRQINNILFVCYNITLVNYIKRLLANKNVPMGDNGVTVKHIYELCSDLIGETVVYENESQDYYDVVVEEALDKIKDCKNRYDAILVDEGQDFNDPMYKVVTSLLNPNTNNLTIALDDNQNIYERKSSWKAVGVQARGRIHKISYVYRNTKELTLFSAKFMGKEAGTGNDTAQTQLELFPDYFDFSGPKPEIQKFPDMKSIVRFIPNKISEVVAQDGCPYSEIVVLYTTKNPGDRSKTPLPIRLEKAMGSQGILCNWTAENVRTKRNYDITTNSISISTIHSAKGFDYACVFLLGLDSLKAGIWTEEQIRKLVYVGITRARYQLYIPFVYQTPVMDKLLASASFS